MISARLTGGATDQPRACEAGHPRGSSNSFHQDRDGFTVAADLEIGAKIFAALTLIILPATVVLGCAIVMVLFG